MEVVAKVPNRLQYVPTGIYYARVKVYGKPVRRRLKSDVHSRALLRLDDFLKEQPSRLSRLGNLSARLCENGIVLPALAFTLPPLAIYKLSEPS